MLNKILNAKTHSFFTSNAKGKIQQIALKTTPIDDKLVTRNRMNKLFGSFGETLVIFHDMTTPIGEFIHFIQEELLHYFPKATQCIEKKEFVTDDGESKNPTMFSIVPNPHTTITAMRVIDSYDKNSWDEHLVQTYLYAKLNQYQPQQEEVEVINQSKIQLLNAINLDDILNKLTPGLLRKILRLEDMTVDIRTFIISQSHASLVTEYSEQMIVNEMLTNHVIDLEIQSISLNANGSLGIKWKMSEQVMELRKALNQIGAIAKHGDNVITTTIGFFPYCTESYRHAINIALQEIICKKIPVNHFETKFQFNLSDMQYVQFARNDLHPDFITTEPFIIQQHIVNSIREQEFPEGLLSRTINLRS